MENNMMDTMFEDSPTRTPKFTEYEQSLLNKFIKKYKHIIMCKKTDIVKPKFRDETWDKIEAEFNADPKVLVRRSKKQLQNKWDYLKRTAKKEASLFKSLQRGTGGGPPPAPLSDTTNFLLATVRESVVGVPSDFDSDNAPNTEPNPDVPVDENEEFSLIYTSNLNKHYIIYGAEMDGIRCDNAEVELTPDPKLGVDEIIKYLSNKQFVELKTNRHIEFPKQQANFRRYKTKKWWCQSFFGGVESILCGFRNDDGIVEELKVFSMRDLVKMSERFWSANVCLNFLDDFLTYVKRCLAKEIRMKHGEIGLNNLQKLPLIYLHFEWNPRRSVRVTKNYDIESDPVLPQWFLDNHAQNRSGV